MPCNCPRCQVLRRLLIHREDPAAPLPGEAWLADNEDTWVWLLLGGLVALLGVAWFPMLLLGLAIAAVAAVRHQATGCRRVPSS